MDHRPSDVEAIVAFSREVADLREPREVLRSLGSRVRSLLPGAGVVVYEVDLGGSPALLVGEGIGPSLRGRAEAVGYLGAGIGGHLLRGGDAHGFDDAQESLLVSGGLVYGALVVLCAARHTADRGPSVVEGLADLAALACDRAHKTAELIRTIDALRASQLALARAEQLKAMGQMASVIAHEVKNPLASISGALQVIQNRVEPRSPEHGVLGKLRQRLSDLDRMVDELLTFARPRPLALAQVDVTGLVRDAVTALERDPRFDGVVVTVEGDRVDADVDRSLLRAVIDNLLINASQAMDGRGRIEVRVRALRGRLELEVADHGPGMSEEVRARLFEPFFTTKSRGTGLGLPTAKWVVDAHHGSIEVRCPLDGGAVFTVRLPSSPWRDLRSS